MSSHRCIMSSHHLNIDEFFSFFPKRQFNLEKKKNKKNRKYRRHNHYDYDKLFFDVLIMINNCDFLKYDKNVETLKKIELLDTIQNKSTQNKRLEKISEVMTTQGKIDVNVLDMIASTFKLNIIIYDDRCYYKMDYGIKDTYFCIDWLYNISEKSSDNISFLTDEKHCIENIQKPFYSMSRYKSDEIKDLFDVLSLKMTIEKPKKKDYYDMMKEYFENSIFNIK